MRSGKLSLPIAAGSCAPCSAAGTCGGGCGSLMAASSLQEPPNSPQDNSSSDSFLPAPDHVLSTLEKDGKRRWLRPKLSKGSWWNRRRIVAYILMVVFVAVPHIRLGGKPLLQLDIAAREFTIFGHTFLPTDTFLLALTILTAFISVVFITAVAGRAWCGWACPQTVYMEFLFRPIDRLFEGTAGKGGKPRKPMSTAKHIGRFLVYLALSMFLAHTFLAYFVGTEKLAAWMRMTPWQHPAAFAVMAVTTGLMLFDFLFFREQMCLIACPYGRFQSVMLDEQSMIVAYDYNRGEPRKKGRRKDGDTAGDCIDCHQCVAVCPTGIDIRDGLQMECINCTQCIDACDAVMAKVNKPLGLIRYSSQDGLENKPKKLLRGRTIVYPIILLAVVSGLGYALSNKFSFDARVMRGKGAPFTTVDRGLISNSFNIKLVNRTDQDQVYQMSIQLPGSARLEILDKEALRLAPGESSVVPIMVRFPASLTFGDGDDPLVLEVTDSSENHREVSTNLLGPLQ